MPASPLVDAGHYGYRSEAGIEVRGVLLQPGATVQRPDGRHLPHPYPTIWRICEDFQHTNDEFSAGFDGSLPFSYQALMPAAAGTPRYENWGYLCLPSRIPARYQGSRRAFVGVTVGRSHRYKVVGGLRLRSGYGGALAPAWPWPAGILACLCLLRPHPTFSKD